MSGAWSRALNPGLVSVFVALALATVSPPAWAQEHCVYCGDIFEGCVTYCDPYAPSGDESGGGSADSGAADGGGSPGDPFPPPRDPFERCTGSGYCTSSAGTATPVLFDPEHDPEAWCDQHATCQKVRHRRNQTERRLNVEDRERPDQVRIAVEQGAAQPATASSQPQAKPPDGIPDNEGQRPTGGDPVSLASGSLALRTVDLTLPGPVRPLEFRRQYDSRSDARSTLGSNWTHNFDVHLRPVGRENAPGWVPADCKSAGTSARCLLLHDGGAERLYVRVPGRGYFVSPTGDAATLHELLDGWVLMGSDGHRLRFDRHGYLVEDRDRFGNGVTIEYEPTGLGIAYDRYCGRLGFYVPNQDTRLCAALDFVFQAGPRQKWDAWGPVPDDELKTVFCPGGQEFSRDEEGRAIRWVARVTDSGVQWFPVPVPEELACAAQGWHRRSGRVPFARQTLEKVHYIDQGLAYIRVALPDEERFEQIYQAAEQLYGDALPADFPRALSRLSFTERHQLFRALVELERLLDQGEIDLRPILRESSVYHTPGNPYGHRRFRPLRVTDDLGRTLTFAYYGGADDDPPRLTGLVKRVDGPAGSGLSVDFTYGEPAHYPRRLNERFLTRVVRTPPAAPFPRDVICVECASGTLDPQGMDYEYAWPPDGPPEPGVHTTYGPHVYGLWLTLADFFVPGEPGVQENNRLASVEALRYVETLADNVVRVTRFAVTGGPTGPVETDRVIELETRFEPSPWRANRDRVVAQRYGGEETGQVDWSEGWHTGLPEWRLEHVEVRLAEPLDGGPPSLPAALLDRYPLESTGPLVREALQDFLASGGEPGGYLRITPPIGLFYFEPAPSEVGSRRLRRTPLGCADLAAAELWDFRPGTAGGGAGSLEALRRRAAIDVNRICRWASVRSRDGVTRHYGFNYRGQVLVQAVYEPVEGRFILTEHRYDADGQVLEVREPTGSDRTRPWSPADGYVQLEYARASDDRAESWRSRLNLVRRTHYPRAAPVAEYSVSTGETVTYAQETRYEYEGAFNQPREVVTGTLDRQGSFGAHYRVRYEFDGGCPEGPVSHACRIAPELCAARLDLLSRLEALYQEVRRRCAQAECLVGDLVPDLERAARVTEAELARGESARSARSAVEAGRELGRRERAAVRDRRPGPRGPERSAGPAADASASGPGQVVERLLVALADWQATVRRRLGPPGFESLDGLRNRCGRPRPDRVVFEHPDVPETRRVVDYRWAPHGRPVEIAQRQGVTVTVAYHDTSYADDRVRSTPGAEALVTPEDYCANPPPGRHCRGEPWGSAADPRRKPDSRGFPAELVQTRYDQDYGPGLPAGTCLDLEAPYRALVPACLAGVDGALGDLGLPEELTALLRLGPTPAVTVMRLRHALTGHPWLVETDGQRTRVHRDVDGRLLRQISADGTVSVAWRDGAGRPRELRTATRQGDLLARAVLRYDREGKPTARCDELDVGGCGPFANQGRLTYPPSAPNENPRFRLRLYRYSDDGLLRTRIDPGSHEEPGSPAEPALLEEWFVYNARGQLVLESLVDPRAPGQGRSRRYAYDTAGQLVRRESGRPGLALAESFGYDGFRRLAHRVDRRGLECRHRYTSRSELSRVRCQRPEAAAGSAWQLRLGYDDHGQVAFEDENGELTRSQVWGPWGRSVRTEITGSGTTHTVFDPSGHPLWMRDAEGNDRVWAALPEARRLAEATVHRGDGPARAETEVTDLDSAGLPALRRRIVRRGPGPATVRTHLWERDAAGRLRRQVDYAGRELRYVRNLAGWPVVVRFGASAELGGAPLETSEIFYDVRGRLRRVVDPTGQDTFFAHNGFDQLTVVAYPGSPGRVYGIFYDDLGRPERFIRPGGSASEFRYDEAGDLTEEWVDDQRRRTFRYDDLGRLELTSDSNRPLAAFGIPRPTVVERHAYDGLSRVSAHALKVGLAPVQEVRIDWSATPGGWRRVVTTPRGGTWTYDFDRVGRLAVLMSPEGDATKFGWLGLHPTGRDQVWDPTAAPLEERAAHDVLGLRSAWRYRLAERPLLDVRANRDAHGRVVSLVERVDGGTDPAPPVQWSGYQYDAYRRLARSWTFRGPDGGLDALLPEGQLLDPLAFDAAIAALGPQAAWKHERDAVGGLTAVVDGASEPARWRHAGPRAPGHRLVDVAIDGADVPVIHDGLGRVTTAGPWRYTFDESDRLVAVERDGALVEAYSYTALGRLAGVYTKEGLDAALAYDGARVVAAHDGLGGARWEAAWGAGPGDLIEWRDLAQDRRYVPLQDHRRSVRLAWDATARELTDRAEYDEYGRLAIRGADQSLRCAETGVEVCVPVARLPFGFLGAWRSPRTGLVHLGARWYSAALGQFLSTDPADYVDGFNLYGFGAQDPINRGDPDGRESQDFTDDATEIFQVEGRYFLDVLKGPGVKERFEIRFHPVTGDPVPILLPAPSPGSPCFDDPAACTCRDNTGRGMGLCAGRVDPSFFPWEPFQIGKAAVELPKLLSALGRTGLALADKGRALLQRLRPPASQPAQSRAAVTATDDALAAARAPATSTAPAAQLPQLKGKTPDELVKEIDEYAKGFTGQEARAQALKVGYEQAKRRMGELYKDAHFEAHPYTAKDGARIFVGGRGEARIVGPDGTLYRTKFDPFDPKVMEPLRNGQFQPDYDALKLVP